MSEKIKGITWDELLEEYFFARNLRPATEWSYQKVVRGFCRFFGDDRTPSMVSHREVLTWRRALLKEKQQSSQTWNNKMAHLRALYNFAMENELLSSDKNPFNKCNVQRDKKKKKTLTRSQLTRVYLVMQHFDDAEKKSQGMKGGRCAISPVWFWLTVLDTLRYTGMRQNQLLHMQIMDVNLTEGCLDLCLEGSKTHREWRVPVVKQLRLRLKHLLTCAAEAGATPADRLFDVSLYTAGRKSSSEKKEVVEMLQKVRSFFRRLSRECGFTVSPHRFRHTLATELMKAPERNLLLVKDLLGHRSVSTTMEYVELKMDIVGKTLEEELSLHTDICVEQEMQVLT